MKTVFKPLIVSFITNASLVFLKLVTGIVTNTNVLIADGIHSLSDLSTDVFAIIGNKLSERKEDSKHPKGHGRIQYLTSVIIGIVIIVLAVSLLKEAILSKASIIEAYLLIVVIITIIVKYALYKYLYKIGIKYNNNILISSARESKADVLSSISVIFIVIASLLSKYIEILKYADKIGTFIISLFILKTGYQIIRENLSLIIGEIETNTEVIDKIKKIILDIDGVIDIDDIILEKYGIYYDAIVKISVNKDITVEKSHSIGKKVKLRLLKSKYKIKYVAIHINPYKN